MIPFPRRVVNCSGVVRPVYGAAAFQSKVSHRRDSEFCIGYFINQCRLERERRPRSKDRILMLNKVIMRAIRQSTGTNGSHSRPNSKNSRPPHWPGFNSATIQARKRDSNEAEREREKGRWHGSLVRTDLDIIRSIRKYFVCPRVAASFDS